MDYYAQARQLFTVQPGSFYPAPKVTSAVIRLDVRKTPKGDLTPEAEKSARIQRLIDRQQAISQEILSTQVGREEWVLVDDVSARDTGCVCGRTPRGHMVNFPGNADSVGTFAHVRIVSAGRNTLRGERIDG